MNYRYVAEELQYLLADANARAIVVHSQFAPTLAEVLPALPNLEVILQVPDSSGNELLPGAIWYEDALAAASPDRPAVDWSPDDLYMLYTGGTTGMPKGVMWRNGDAMVECFGGSKTATSIADFVAEAKKGSRALIGPPFMHGAGHWVAFSTLLGGGTVFVQSVPERLDPVDMWSLVEREKLNFMLIVGDAFARPLLDELDRNPYDLSSLIVILSGGAPLSANLKDELLAHLPTLMIVDGLGSSEAGGQVSHVSVGGSATTGSFEIAPGNRRAVGRPRPGARTGRRGDRLARQGGPAGARLPRRRGEDGAHVSRGRRCALRRSRRPGPPPRRRCRRAARP